MIEYTLITGSKGFAKQLLDVFFQLNNQEGLVFYDDYDPSIKSLYEFTVLKSIESAESHFKQNGPNFVLGTGNPRIREMMKNRFEGIGGKCISIISPLSRIARNATIGSGSCVMTGAIVENDVNIGQGSLLNLNALICHDCQVGDFVEICPGAILTGSCSVGDFSFIGSGAVLKPGVKVGHHSIVAAGSVVIEDVPDYTMVAGVPAKVKKTLHSLW